MPPVSKERTRDYQREWRAKNPDRARAITRRAHEAARRRNREIIRTAKDAPCTDCGMRYPYYVMQFDHVRGSKLFTIGFGVVRRTKRQLLSEIVKCDVVCSNCHAERTYGKKRSISSEVERFPDTEEVIGANPISITPRW